MTWLGYNLSKVVEMLFIFTFYLKFFLKVRNKYEDFVALIKHMLACAMLCRALPIKTSFQEKVGKNLCGLLHPIKLSNQL